MLNLAQLTPQVKQAAAIAAQRLLSEPARPYTRNTDPVDGKRIFNRRCTVSHKNDVAQMSVLYPALRALGWQPTGKVHPVDRVSLLALGEALIHRDPDFKPLHWVIEIGGVEHALAGSPEAVTAEVERLLAALIPAPTPTLPQRGREQTSSSPLPEGEGSGARSEAEDPQPRRLTPEQEEADGLKAEYPELAARVDAALALIESGDLAAQQKKYGTTWHNQTRYGVWFCGCPDSLHRQPTAKFGRACKHALGGEILARAKRTANRIAQQKLGSDVERQVARERVTAKAAAERAQSLPASVAPTSIEDWLGYDDQPLAPNPQPLASRPSAADIIRQIEEENAAKFAKQKTAYNNALKPGGGGPLAQTRAEFRGIGHL